MHAVVEAHSIPSQSHHPKVFGKLMRQPLVANEAEVAKQ
jgi:hypothetical protein